MEDCWYVLGIDPTTDADIIKKAYRNLIKQYHPDTTVVPEIKRNNTLLCMQVNAAYKEALEQARRGILGEQIYSISILGIHSAIFKSKFLMLTIVGGILLTFIGFALMPLFQHLPEGGFAKSFLTVGFLIISTAIFFGIFISGLTAGLAVFLLSKTRTFAKFLERSGIEKYRTKLLWLVLLLLNLSLFFFLGQETQAAGNNYDLLIRVTGSMTLPLLLLLDWIYKITAYRKIKDQMNRLERETWFADHALN